MLTYRRSNRELNFFCNGLTRLLVGIVNLLFKHIVVALETQRFAQFCHSLHLEGCYQVDESVAIQVLKKFQKCVLASDSFQKDGLLVFCKVDFFDELGSVVHLEYLRHGKVVKFLLYFSLYCSEEHQCFVSKDFLFLRVV